MRTKIDGFAKFWAVGAPAILLAISQMAFARETGSIERGDFRFTYGENGISALANPNDPFGATMMPAGGGAATLGLEIQYQTGTSKDWTRLKARQTFKASPQSATVTYSNAGSDDPLRVTETYTTDGDKLDWTIQLSAVGSAPVRIGDLSVRIPTVGPSGGSPSRIFEHGFLSHQFISGDGSFIYWVRASGAPPFMLLTAQPGTKLEYSGGSGGGSGRTSAYVHSLVSGGSITEGTWRQEHTALDLAPGESKTYAFRIQFADSYDKLRNQIYENGLFDVRVVPGMTVPEDLTARISLHTMANIESIRPEFPEATTITPLGESQPDHHLYEVAFNKRGENMLTIVHDGGRETHLEFFVTEPLETLIKKRAAFIVDKQQIKDPSKWWDGVYGPYDMKNGVTRSIEDPDIFLNRMVYVLTCDNPGLCKAPYLASKNVTYPNQREIDSLEYYLEHFVWGGLQRTDDERPYPYGIYGTPGWHTARDMDLRRELANSTNDRRAIKDLAKEHVWRSYDYPHVIMLYYHMYQIAKMYPDMVHYLDADGYLKRAMETARAFYIYPYEIYPEYYETYKWGLYNELVVLELMATMEKEGFQQQADELRHQWEIKTKYFVYDDPYPFRSEFAFDRTAFESSYAFAKYGATHSMQPDENLWYDLRLKRHYSHPVVRRADSRDFMDRQLAAGLSVRGWLNPGFYRLGADHGVSYMAAMGGWGILDYGINFAPEPWDWLQLGYASYLSSWCLMNTGTPESNYGFWFPGRKNDGAAGWEFQSSKVISNWMASEAPGEYRIPRGPWNYDGEIDLGYGSALRTAATLVTNDPVFGWFAYGGAMTVDGDRLSVNPRDGIRRRLKVVIPDASLPIPDAIRRLKIEVARDGFAPDQDIVMDKKLNTISFTLENRSGDAHSTGIMLSFPDHSEYELRQDGKPVAMTLTDDWEHPYRAQLAMRGPTSRIELVRTNRAQ